MRILACDDERIPLELLAFAEHSRADVAFLDIQMYGITGLELAKRLKDRMPEINIIFVTGYSQYAGDAFQLRASGYVMKPTTKEMIEVELKNLRHPVAEKPTARLLVQCFGNFEVYADGKPLRFEFSRSKELFAYLVDRRGAAVNTYHGEYMAQYSWAEMTLSSLERKQDRT